MSQLTKTERTWSITAFGRAVRRGYFDVIDPGLRARHRTPAGALRDVLIAHRVDLLAVALGVGGVVVAAE